MVSRHRLRHRLRPVIGAATCLVALFLTGCGAGSSPTTAAWTPTPNPTATATPETVTVPAIHTITLNNFMASYVFPTAHGFMLFGNPGTVGQPIGWAGARALYYYDNAAQQVQQVAVPTPSTDGVERGIRAMIAAGDWTIYDVADANDTHWEVWALNLTTKQRRLVGSAASEQSPLVFYASMVTDGTSLVWSHATPTAGNTFHHVLMVYDLASGNARTLETTPAGTNDIPEAMANGAVVFDRRAGDTTTTDSLWLWTLGDSAPKQISTNPGLNFTMNDQYIVWDDVHSHSLIFYDRATGQENDNTWVASCIRPWMALDRPYLVCIDFDPSTYRLVRVPSGANATFYEGKASSKVIFIGNDRAYWVATPQHSPYSNQIDYFDLPTT